MAIIIKNDYHDDIARGQFTRLSAVDKFGHNDVGTTITTVAESVASGSLYEYIDAASPGTGIVVYAISTSTDDTDGGDGARTIQIWGKDKHDKIQTEVVTMDGTTTSATSTAVSVYEYTRIERALVLTAGSSTGTVGVITIENFASDKTFAQISVGANQTAMAITTIGAGYEFLADQFSLFSFTTKADELSFHIRERGKYGATATFREVKTWIVKDGSILDPQKIPKLYTEKTDLEVRGITTGSATHVDADFQGTLRQVHSVPIDFTNYSATAPASTGTILVSWDEMTPAETSDMSHFMITVTQESNGSPVAKKSLEAKDAIGHTFTGLYDGVEYTVISKWVGSIAGEENTIEDDDLTVDLEVTSLSATSDENTKSVVTWTECTGDFASQELWYGLSGDADTRFFGTIDNTGTDLVGLVNDSEYTIVIKVVNAAGHISGGVSTTATPDYAAPEDFAVAVNDEVKIELSWTDSSTEETGIEIWRSIETGTGFSLLDTVSTDETSYDDEAADYNQEYFYKARFDSAHGEGDFTAEDSDTLIIFAPDTLVATAGDDTVNITWSINSVVATEQLIYRSLETGTNYSLLDTIADNSTETYDDNTAENDTEYFYVITAGDGVDESPYSGEVNATPAIGTFMVSAIFDPISGPTDSLYLLSGDNGETWTEKTVGETAYDVTAMAMNDANVTLAMVVPDAGDAKLYQSSNGISWAEEGSYIPSSISSAGDIVMRKTTANLKESSTDGSAWTTMTGTAAADELGSAVKMGGNYYMVEATAGVLKSSDGIAWVAMTNQPSSMGDDPSLSASATVLLLTTNTNGDLTTLLYRFAAGDVAWADGTSQISGTAIAPGYKNGSTFFNNKFWSVAYEDDVSSGYYESSSDGNTWSSETGPATETPFSIGTDGTKLIMGMGDASFEGYTAYSADGTTWSSPATTGGSATKIPTFIKGRS